MLGAIVLGRFENTDVVRLLESQYRHLVYVGRNPVSASWDQIICDGYEATSIAISYLHTCGHKRIAYIGETDNEIRYKAYKDQIISLGLHDDPTLTAICNQNTAEGGYKGAGILLEKASSMPTAVFCASDISAIAAMRRFREAGIKLPTQLSVIGMDNIELSGYVSPMLTTVGMPTVEMGSCAAQTLINRINKMHRLPSKLYIPNKLAIRESVASLNGAVGDGWHGMYI
jgi:DNA-binding LacI/PurR family transcriptional regulator